MNDLDRICKLEVGVWEGMRFVTGAKPVALTARQTQLANAMAHAMADAITLRTRDGMFGAVVHRSAYDADRAWYDAMGLLPVADAASAG